MRVNVRKLVAVLISLSLSQPVLAQWGKFEGRFAFQWARDGRNMKLLEKLVYVDQQGARWEVPSGTVTDGASVPQAFWIIYPPFTGSYRSAAVVHDFYCQSKTRRWQDVHNMFYDAMRASGVREADAKLLWSAVYAFGPRWGAGSTRSVTAKRNPTSKNQEQTIERLKRWIANENPSRDDIVDAIEEGNIPN